MPIKHTGKGSQMKEELIKLLQEKWVPCRIETAEHSQGVDAMLYVSVRDDRVGAEVQVHGEPVIKLAMP
jgi:hypothetical protein